MGARLISPTGEVIELSDEQYLQIREFLPEKPALSSHSIIDQLCGSLADGTSLREWYFAEKAAEKALEEKKLSRL